MEWEVTEGRIWLGSLDLKEKKRHPSPQKSDQFYREGKTGVTFFSGDNTEMTIMKTKFPPRQTQ